MSDGWRIKKIKNLEEQNRRLKALLKQVDKMVGYPVYDTCPICRQSERHTNDCELTKELVKR